MDENIGVKMKLKHYKGDGWEVKVKYDEDFQILLWEAQDNTIPMAEGGKINTVIENINIKYEGNLYINKDLYQELSDHLDSLTRNEREFKNDNFHIKVWETEDKIGAETVWIREGFKYRQKDNNTLVIDAETTTYIWDGVHYPDFGIAITKKDKNKSQINYTFTDLCKALERAEQETSELTYDTVVKELEGLKGEELWKAMEKYEYNFIVNDFWHKITRNANFFTAKELFKRGLIKLRRVK